MHDAAITAMLNNAAMRRVSVDYSYRE